MARQNNIQKCKPIKISKDTNRYSVDPLLQPSIHCTYSTPIDSISHRALFFSAFLKIGYITVYDAPYTVAYFKNKLKFLQQKKTCKNFRNYKYRRNKYKSNSSCIRSHLRPLSRVDNDAERGWAKQILHVNIRLWCIERKTQLLYTLHLYDSHSSDFKNVNELSESFEVYTSEKRSRRTQSATDTLIRYCMGALKKKLAKSDIVWCSLYGIKRQSTLMKL